MSSVIRIEELTEDEQDALMNAIIIRYVDYIVTDRPLWNATLFDSVVEIKTDRDTYNSSVDAELIQIDGWWTPDRRSPWHHEFSPTLRGHVKTLERVFPKEGYYKIILTSQIEEEISRKIEELSDFLRA